VWVVLYIPYRTLLSSSGFINKLYKKKEMGTLMLITMPDSISLFDVEELLCFYRCFNFLLLTC